MSSKPPTSRPGRLHQALRWIAVLLLLFLVAWHVDLRSAWQSLRTASPAWLLAGLAGVQLQVLLSALRWRFTAARLGVKLVPGTAIGEYFLATLLNQTLPGGMGGDAIRAWRHAGNSGDTARAVRAVVLERLAGQVALFVLVAIGLVAWPMLAGGQERPQGLATSLLAVTGVVMAVALCLGALARFGPARIRIALHGVGPDLAQAWWRQGAWLPQLALSAAIVAGYIAVLAACARAVGDVMPPLAWLIILPLTLASMTLPVSVGGWGVREAAAAALWPLVGLPSAHGVAASVLYGLINVIGALPGLWCLRARRDDLPQP